MDDPKTPNDYFATTMDKRASQGNSKLQNGDSKSIEVNQRADPQIQLTSGTAHLSKRDSPMELTGLPKQEPLAPKIKQKTKMRGMIEIPQPKVAQPHIATGGNDTIMTMNKRDSLENMETVGPSRRPP